MLLGSKNITISQFLIVLPRSDITDMFYPIGKEKIQATHQDALTGPGLFREAGRVMPENHNRGAAAPKHEASTPHRKKMASGLLIRAQEKMCFLFQLLCPHCTEPCSQKQVLAVTPNYYRTQKQGSISNVTCSSKCTLKKGNYN